MGAATDDFHEVVMAIVKNHDAEHDGEFTVRDSKKGRFQSVVVTINATGEPQLRALYEELKGSGPGTNGALITLSHNHRNPKK